MKNGIAIILMIMNRALHVWAGNYSLSHIPLNVLHGPPRLIITLTLWS